MSTFWIDSRNGIDSDSGHSRNTPWKTLEPLNAALAANKIGRGDVVLLRSGGVYPGGISGIPAGVARQEPLVFGAYGDGDRPVLEGYKVLNVAGGWQEHAAGVWKIDLTQASGQAGNYTGVQSVRLDPGFLKVDGVIKPRQKHTLASLTAGNPQPWDFFCDAQYLYVIASARPTTLAADIRAAVRSNGFAGQSRVLVQGLELRGFGGHGYRHAGVGTASIVGVQLVDLALHELGGAHLSTEYLTGGSDFSRFGNAFEAWINTEDLLIEGCEVSDVYDAAFTLQGTAVAGALNGWTDVEFVGNRVWACNQSVEYWSSPAATPVAAVGHQRVRVHDNVFGAGGYSWGDTVRADTAGKANHVMTYGLALPVDIEHTGNLFALAKQNYSYHSQANQTDLTVPAGFRSHDNTIVLEAGKLMQWAKAGVPGGDAFTIDRAQEWATARGTEQGSQFVQLPGSIDLSGLPSERVLEVVLSEVEARTALGTDIANRALREAGRAAGVARRAWARMLSFGNGSHDAPLDADKWHWPRYSSAQMLASASLGTNAFKALPFTFNGSGYIDQLAFNVVTAGDAASIVRLGVYRKEGGRYLLVSDAGAVSTATAGIKTVTLSTPFWVREGETLYVGMSLPIGNATQPQITGTKGTADQRFSIQTSSLAYAFGTHINAISISGIVAGLPAAPPTVGLSDAAALIYVHAVA